MGSPDSLGEQQVQVGQWPLPEVPGVDASKTVQHAGEFGLVGHQEGPDVVLEHVHWDVVLYSANRSVAESNYVGVTDFEVDLVVRELRIGKKDLEVRGHESERV